MIISDGVGGHYTTLRLEGRDRDSYQSIHWTTKRSPQETYNELLCMLRTPPSSEIHASLPSASQFSIKVASNVSSLPSGLSPLIFA